MGLRESRKSRKLTQRELAQRSGVNFRSLQDYEQGHKKLTSASGDILLRLSRVLGCTTEELLLGDAGGALLLSSNQLESAPFRGSDSIVKSIRRQGDGCAATTVFRHCFITIVSNIQFLLRRCLRL